MVGTMIILVLVGIEIVRIFTRVWEVFWIQVRRRELEVRFAAKFVASVSTSSTGLQSAANLENERKIMQKLIFVVWLTVCATAYVQNVYYLAPCSGTEYRDYYVTVELNILTIRLPLVTIDNDPDRMARQVSSNGLRLTFNSKHLHESDDALDPTIERTLIYTMCGAINKRGKFDERTNWIPSRSTAEWEDFCAVHVLSKVEKDRLTPDTHDLYDR